MSDMRSLAIMRDTGCPVVFGRHAFGAIAGRIGHVKRRRAAIRADSGSRGHCGWRIGRVHGDASHTWDTALAMARTRAAARMKALLEQMVAIDRVVKAQTLAESMLVGAAQVVGRRTVPLGTVGPRKNFDLLLTGNL